MDRLISNLTIQVIPAFFTGSARPPSYREIYGVSGLWAPAVASFVTPFSVLSTKNLKSVFPVLHCWPMVAGACSHELIPWSFLAQHHLLCAAGTGLPQGIAATGGGTRGALVSSHQFMGRRSKNCTTDCALPRGFLLTHFVAD